MALNVDRTFTYDTTHVLPGPRSCLHVFWLLLKKSNLF